MTELPPDPFDALPPQLVDTLARSFADRRAGVPLAQANLMFGFRADEPPPATLGDALRNLGPTAVNLLVHMFERMAVLDPTGGLWQQIRYVGNQWWGGSAGMKVAYRDPAAMRACLDGLLAPSARPTVARDTYLGAIEHQSSSVAVLVARGILAGWPSDLEPPDCDTWREVDVLGREAMHFCVRKGDSPVSATQLDDIHLDWSSPVSGIDRRTGRCRYALGVSLRHWLEARFGIAAPAFVFVEVEEQLARLGATESAAGGDSRYREFARRWEEEKWRLAVRGKAGEEEARRFREELSSDTRRCT